MGIRPKGLLFKLGLAHGMGHTGEGMDLGREAQSYLMGWDQEGKAQPKGQGQGHTLACSQNCSRLIRFISTAASVF